MKHPATTDIRTPVNFGSIFGSAEKPSFITPHGPVWMWRKGQKVRFYTAEGVQIGPEQRNVCPAICAAYYEGWIDPSCPAWLNAGCIAEVRGTVPKASEAKRAA